MANTQQENKQGTPATVPANNGAGQTAAPKRQVRTVPAIGCTPSKEEYDFIKGKVDAALAQLKAAGVPGVELSIGKFTLAHALNSMGFKPATK